MRNNNEKISWLNIILSMFIGVGGAYLFKDIISEHIPEVYVSGAIGLVAIVADKVGEFLIYKAKFDVLLIALFNNFISFVSNPFKK